MEASIQLDGCRSCVNTDALQRRASHLSNIQIIISAAFLESAVDSMEGCRLTSYGYMNARDTLPYGT